MVSRSGKGPRAKNYTLMRDPGSGVRGKMTVARRSWVSIDNLTLVELAHPDPVFIASLQEGDLRDSYVESIDQDREGVRLDIRTGSARLSLPLDGYTVPELLVMRYFISRVIESALPTAMARDKIAQEAYDEYGDDSHLRLYRRVPKVSYRKGDVAAHSQGLLGGPEDAAELADGGGDHAGAGLRDDGGGMVERDEGRSEASDNAATTGDTEVVRPVVRQPILPPSVPSAYRREG